MGKVNFFGLMQIPLILYIVINIMMDNGGEVSPMVQESIKRLMEINMKVHLKMA